MSWLIKCVCVCVCRCVMRVCRYYGYACLVGSDAVDVVVSDDGVNRSLVWCVTISVCNNDDVVDL
jgi:hypothetical protein